METLVSEISCSLNLTHQHTAASTSISLVSSPHMLPSSTKPATTTTTALLNADKKKSTPSPLLPLPPSRPLFPSPLKFLWFGRESPATLPPKSSDPSPLPLEIAELDLEDPAMTAPKPCTCFLNSDSHASNAELIAIDDIKCSDETQISMDSSLQLNSEEWSSLRTPSSDSEKNWISRFLRLRLLWKESDPELKSSREIVEPALLIAAKEADEALKVVANKGGDDVDEGVIDGNFQLSTSEDDQGVCILEASQESVVHDRESVSMFLHEVPVAEVQAISKLCLLSNMAYIIPEVQSKNLLKEHHLSFVTSSLVKKEEAEAKAALEKSVIQASKEKNIRGKKRLKTQEQIAVLEKALRDAESLDKVSSSSQILLCAKAASKEARTVNFAPQLQVPKPANDVETSLEGTINKAAQEDILKVQGSCPCEWFICDDEASSTRYLVIQGSESLASWQTNLSFDPTKFEGLGVLVHRGIYEAAQGLYKMVEREIVEHISKGSHARLCFTGHSLGGSLATLLAMMLVKRGVVRASAVEGVVTLGAACVLCAGERLLTQLGLEERQFVNVVMHRDIVPRAFACDYPDHVTRLLKRLNSTFRDHPCLNYQRLLYSPVGQVMILQPDDAQSPGHPLLPSTKAGLYLIKHPQDGELEKVRSRGRQAALDVREAQRAFFNMPHPLDMLRDPGAYGFEGAISRDHDPRSYKRAITTVLSQGLKQLKGLTTQQRRPQVNNNILFPSLAVPRALDPIMLPHLAPSASSFSPSSPIQKHVLHHSSRLIASQHIHMGLLLILSITTELFSSFLSWV